MPTRPYTLHPNPGVRDLLEKYHMHNFSIYMSQLDDGKDYLFGYYEYTGTDYKADMEKLGAEPRNQKWLSVTGPMQVPLPGGTVLGDDEGGLSQSLGRRSLGCRGQE